jgi:DNA helicase-2/ATP-dependent DNA helicase PcrA
MARRVYKLEAPAPRVAYKIDYDSLLNEEQREVVMADRGKLLVLAGAGSGKTRTLTYRVARLLESGVLPERILLLTFTNKAAREMLGRVGNLLGELPKGLWGGTFHHVGALILRRHAHRLDYAPQWGILDVEDAESLMNLAVGDANVDVTQRRFPRAAQLVKLHSYAVNTGTPFADAVLQKAPEDSEILHQIEAVFGAYQVRKRQTGVMDFDDLLVNWKRLFAEHPDIAEEYGRRFEHVMVDEYQDTNQLQGELVDLCAAGNGNLMAVGDDCQSIFRFRGAEFSNILDFPKRHENTRIFKLQTNYRSSPEILELANRSIRFNARQFHKSLRSVQPGSERPAFVTCKDASQQAAFIAQRVLELRDEGIPLNDMAVLYRAHYQSMELQVELNRRSIPYIVRSGIRFFEQSHIKDVLSFLRVVFNPADQIAFYRILRTADGVGKNYSDQIWRSLTGFSDLSEGWAADGIADALPRRARGGWDATRRLLIRLQNLHKAEKSPAEMVDAVLQGGYRAYARRTFDNVESRMVDLDQLANFASQYDNLEKFLTELSLSGTVASEEVADSGVMDEHLILSSIHQAKGLEFRAVFVLWLSEGRFPTVRADDPENIEEERRLFYVAVTRAKTDLYLCHPIVAKDRELGITFLRPSPFIEELGDDLFDSWSLTEG